MISIISLAIWFLRMMAIGAIRSEGLRARAANDNKDICTIQGQNGKYVGLI